MYEDELIDLLHDLKIICPECRNIDDDQYQCCTCGCSGSYNQVRVVYLLKEHPNLLQRLLGNE